MDFGDLKPQDLSVLIPKAPKEAIEIIDSLLQLCPSKRASLTDVINLFCNSLTFILILPFKLKRFLRTSGYLQQQNKDSTNLSHLHNLTSL